MLRDNEQKLKECIFLKVGDNEFLFEGEYVNMVIDFILSIFNGQYVSLSYMMSSKFLFCDDYYFFKFLSERFGFVRFVGFVYFGTEVLLQFLLRKE